MRRIASIPRNEKKRVVVVGGGFAGTRLVKKLLKHKFQVVLIDKNNYYQFQPLFYQVAMAGLEPSAISFPLRRMFQGQKGFHFRMGEVLRVRPEKNELETSIGSIEYDYLVMATGVTTNFFGNKNVEEKAASMKSVSDAIFIRNKILANYEKAINCETDEERQKYLNIVIVGGGPAGVELAGSLAELKKYILPKDYHEMNFHNMKVYLFEAAPKILGAMRERSSRTATRYLEKLDVEIRLNTAVQDYDGKKVVVTDGTELETETLIWTAGVAAKRFEGFPEESFGYANRLLVNDYNRVKGTENIFAIGDIALMQNEDYPKGHPQVAQTAIQQANLLGKNMKRLVNGKTPSSFQYFDKGVLATIGRNLAVADLPGITLKGFAAWFIWSVVHLLSISGAKNKIFVFIDWAMNYLIYDPSLRLLIRPKVKCREED
ncbi:MAG: NAD(P)/FAD-dependent oxidoreductase [Bacteroidales bacterium]|nr:NAD(P)/FAD-dependent oxidoreductase [Bacteroidales bacterium]